MYRRSLCIWCGSLRADLRVHAPRRRDVRGAQPKARCSRRGDGARRDVPAEARGGGSRLAGPAKHERAQHLQAKEEGIVRSG